MRPIDGDNLIERIEFTARHYVVRDEFDKGRVVGWNNVIKAVRDYVPTVDAVPVRHGEWIDVNYDGSLWRCSICGETQCCKSNYCGDCGAKMDGGTNDADD